MRVHGAEIAFMRCVRRDMDWGVAENEAAVTKICSFFVPRVNNANLAFAKNNVL